MSKYDQKEKPGTEVFHVKGNKAFRKAYSIDLLREMDVNYSGKEKQLKDAFFIELKERYKITSPAHIMLLDTACHDFIRIKRLQKVLIKHGDVGIVTSRMGNDYVKANEASYLLNAVETQFRSNLRELLMTKKEEIKTVLSIDRKDFSSWLSENIVEVEVGDEKHESDEKTS